MNAENTTHEDKVNEWDHAWINLKFKQNMMQKYNTK